MNLDPLTKIFSVVSGNSRLNRYLYEKALEQGKILDTFPMHEQTLDVFVDYAPALYYARGDKKALLIFNDGNECFSRSLPVKELRGMIQNHVWANAGRLQDFHDFSKEFSDAYDRRSLIEERDRLEKTIAFFESETGLSIHDPIREDSRKRYYKDWRGWQEPEKYAVIDLAIEAQKRCARAGGVRGDLQTSPDKHRVAAQTHARIINEKHLRN